MATTNLRRGRDPELHELVPSALAARYGGLPGQLIGVLDETSGSIIGARMLAGVAGGTDAVLVTVSADSPLAYFVPLVALPSYAIEISAAVTLEVPYEVSTLVETDPFELAWARVPVVQIIDASTGDNVTANYTVTLPTESVADVLRKIVLTPKDETVVTANVLVSLA